MDWDQVFNEHRNGIIFGLLGLLFLGIGILTSITIFYEFQHPEVEVLTNETDSDQIAKQIVVDVEGGVVKPGIYRLTGDVRIQDALTEAGGLSAEADREWVQRYINLAQKAIDGSKIYIPLIGEKMSDTAVQEDDAVLGAGDPSYYVTGAININNATQSQLETLKGIGEKRAIAIIENRPYEEIGELVEKNILSEKVFLEIKDQLVVY
jgi:competence protein ComEA